MSVEKCNKCQKKFDVFCIGGGAICGAEREPIICPYCGTTVREERTTGTFTTKKIEEKVVVSEANIIVDGRQLTKAESMTVRVALNSFISELNENGLGDDQHGKDMVKLYTGNAQSVLETIHKA